MMIRWLLNHFLFAGTMFFAAGAVADVASGAEAGGAGDDGGSAENSGDGVDDAGGVSDAAADDAQSGENAEQVDAPKETAGGKPDAKVDARSLPPAVRDFMKDLQAKDAKAHGWLKDVLFRDRQLAQIVPGGMKEIQTLKTQAETLTRELGPEGLEGVKQERAEWEAIDNAYQNADPRYLDTIIEANPESFKKFAPLAMNKLAQVDPEGYQRHMCNVIMSTFQSAGVVASLRYLDRALQMKDVEGAQGLAKEIGDWVKAIEDTAKSQPKPVEKDPALDARKAELDSREFSLWVNDTASKINTFKSSAIRKELGQYLKGTQVDDETYEAIEGQTLKYLDQLLNSDPQFKPTFEAYVNAKDREGVTRFIQSKLQELLPSKPGKPGPVEKAHKLFFRGAAPAVRPKPVAAAKPGQPAAAAPKGWVKIGQAPKPHEIDGNKSPFEMRFNQQAILRDGRRVYWGDRIPS